MKRAGGATLVDGHLWGQQGSQDRQAAIQVDSPGAASKFAKAIQDQCDQ